MTGVYSPEDICNLALGHMGNLNTVTNITTPTNASEITFALWYDICRKTLLKYVMPNFALRRDHLTKVTNITIPFGYCRAYRYPSNCLKLLGIDIIEKKNYYPYAVENGLILMDGSWDHLVEPFCDKGLPIRYIFDHTDVPTMSPEFIMLFSLFLAGKTVMPITQSLEKKKLVEALMPDELRAVSGVNAQENPPIRKSNSRYLNSRLYVQRNYPDKR